ncbi:DNA polymerase II large subunit [Candidatus Woesearchaeota archaeon]|nr:DNA polymerase II large subunit [Candidatus Woesearchaeota archaeon]
MSVVASSRLEIYFKNIQDEISRMHSIASTAKSLNMDPVPRVEIALAANMAERVVGLISVLAPQIVSSGVVERIGELESEFGALDWRVALKISEEIAQQKFCSFKNQLEAIDIGVRTGFAYSTVGVVSSPLDGLVSIEVKKRLDNLGEYFCLHFAGPIRNAGGTNAAFCAIIADYVRKKMGYAKYDCSDDEALRAVTELEDYHDKVTNLQYFPSKSEVLFLLKNIPIEIGGEPSEKIEVSNYKDLPRTSTNFIRSGYCLLLSSCIPLKAPKLWKQLSSWGKDFGMDDWNFLEEFLKVQKASKSGGVVKKEGKISPDYTYISDLVAGRPIFGYPLEKGGFRLRYGRARCSGYSAQAVHPATMFILDNFFAIGTQLKCERPGKGAVYTVCDSIEGPIVKLNNGDVHIVDSSSKARLLSKDIEEILYLGDVLINYGDFFNRAHVLVPPGYCEEWWVLEVEKSCVEMFGSLDFSKISDITGISEDRIVEIVKSSFSVKPSAVEALIISKNTKTPLHPRYSYHYNGVSVEQLNSLREWFFSRIKSSDTNNSLVLPFDSGNKRVLEILGVPHTNSLNEFVVISGDDSLIIKECFSIGGVSEFGVSGVLSTVNSSGGVSNGVEWINKISPVMIRDKSGIFIGSRMGRPEKAKMRKMKGSPHGLFPVGSEGGRLRSLSESIRKGSVTADFPVYFCSGCGVETVYPKCHVCNSVAVRKFWCQECSKYLGVNVCDIHGPCKLHLKKTVLVKKYFDNAMKLSGLPLPPDLIKGVKGTFNDDHYPENMIKPMLRAKYGLAVNKDGTVRYDCSELPLTHFRPFEIQTSVQKLRELGYSHDINGQVLESDNQILEILPQDVVLPSCPVSPNEKSHDFLIGVCSFIDDLLVHAYNLPRFYNVKSKDDLIGHLIVALAPHTSAGLACRIIGFSKTQGFFSHPYVHAACRRDCDGDEIGYILLLDALINFSKHYLPSSRGSTMDAPLVLTSVLNPSEVDDMAFDVDISKGYQLDFYDACINYKMPWDVKVRQIKHVLRTPEQYERMFYTHETSDINEGVLCSAYKTLPTMEDKLKGQMNLAVKIRAVNAPDVARLVIDKHFLKDTKGNLRKFTTQEFRCVECNEIHRRPPLRGVCKACGGKIIFTVSEGSVTKYFEPMQSLAKKYGVSPYLQQTIDLLRLRIEGVFGRDKEKQSALGAWFG